MGSPVVWSRHVAAPIGTPFCAVVGVADSVITACFGRWQPCDADEIRWVVREDERCKGCVRELERSDEDPLLDPTWTGEGPRNDEPGAFDHLTEEPG